jgi:hypothetical protein
MNSLGLVEGTRELLEYPYITSSSTKCMMMVARWSYFRLYTAREIGKTKGADTCAKSFDLSVTSGAAGKD